MEIVVCPLFLIGTPIVGRPYRDPQFNLSLIAIECIIAVSYITPMDLIYTAVAAKALRDLPRRDADSLAATLVTFAADPYAAHGWAKAFGGGAFRVRQGDYRAVVDVDQGAVTVVVVKIGNRKEVYK